mmetsp:Transcript_2552/g.6037  ORF Transcript_2552/g.6037 Transcript_2552/m.6037 type:complete len:225 (+) Transcript_2552:85-759(+)
MIVDFSDHIPVEVNREFWWVLSWCELNPIIGHPRLELRHDVCWHIVPDSVIDQLVLDRRQPPLRRNALTVRAGQLVFHIMDLHPRHCFCTRLLLQHCHHLVRPLFSLAGDISSLKSPHSQLDCVSNLHPLLPPHPLLVVVSCQCPACVPLLENILLCDTERRVGASNLRVAFQHMSIEPHSCLPLVLELLQEAVTLLPNSHQYLVSLLKVVPQLFYLGVHVMHS